MESCKDDPHRYDDIIHLPHPISRRHPQMPISDRAAQFLPFAALTGYGDVIQETARTTDRKPELSEDEKAALEYKLRAALSFPGEKPVISITYFVSDERKSGGTFQTISGQIKKIEENRQTLVLTDGTRIAWTVCWISGSEPLSRCFGWFSPVPLLTRNSLLGDSSSYLTNGVSGLTARVAKKEGIPHSWR